MAVPPELMQLLQQGGGGAPAGMDAGAPAGGPMGGDGPSPQEAASSPFYGGGGVGGQQTDALRAALDALEQYARAEDDEQNIQVVQKCVTALQGILANEEKMVDGALGGNADPRALRRLSGGQGAGPSY